MKKSIQWLTVFFAVFLAAVGLAVGLVVYIDPYMHYHAPLTNQFFYELADVEERNLNDGIARNMCFNGVIVGTSMTENFRTSIAEELFGGTWVKLPFSGSSFRESAMALETALKNQKGLRCVIRGLDMGKLIEDPELLRWDLGDYPTYLYDDDPFNDVYYVLNRDMLYNRCLSMLMDREKTGITDFDDYACWQKKYVFGPSQALGEHKEFTRAEEQRHLTDAERATLRENITQNVGALAEAYPQVEFYCFFTPYSAVWWGEALERGTFLRQLEAERAAAELLLAYDNLHLFSWNTVEQVTLDLNNYKDDRHYAQWVNDWMLRQMATGYGLLTAENLKQMLSKEKKLYWQFDYASLFLQTDTVGEKIPEFFLQ